jgi:hypothetical protein
MARPGLGDPHEVLDREEAMTEILAEGEAQA